MTTLHLIRDSALNNSTITLALTNLSANDVIVLLDDGCYNINQAFINNAQTIVPFAQCYAINEHVVARSLPLSAITLIDYQQLVELIFNHNNTITWQ